MKWCRLILVSLLFLAYSNSFGQKNYTVVYGGTANIKDSLLKNGGFSEFSLVIQDSIAYCYYPQFLTKLNREKNMPLGSAYGGKAVFLDSKKKIKIFQQGPPSKPKQQRLVETKSDTGTWTISEERKDIQGYDCIKAYGKINNRNYTVWFSPELPTGFGPFMMTGLPGTILECRDGDPSILTIATSVVEGGLPIVEPNFCKRIREWR